MTIEQVQYQVGDGLATVTLHRPERLNAWTSVMERQVRQAMEEAASDRQVRVIILTGAGRGFCAGLDLDGLKEREGQPAAVASAPSLGRRGNDESDGQFAGRFTYFPAIPKPIIAAINGPVAGSGFVLALACDLRFAGSEAILTTSFARRGLTAEHGVSWLLPRLVGMAHAQDLLLSGRRITASEAQAIGLVNRVIPQSELMAEARNYARDMSESCSPRSLAVIKRQLWNGMFQSLAEAVSRADREMRASFGSEDFREGIAHMREKRPARFSGN